jgi:hypothetical protein
MLYLCRNVPRETNLIDVMEIIKISDIKKKERTAFQKQSASLLDVNVTDIARNTSIIVLILAIATNILSIVGGVYGIYSYMFEHTNIIWIAWTFSIILITLLEIAATWFFWVAWKSLFSTSIIPSFRAKFVIIFFVLGGLVYYQSYRATTSGFKNFAQESDHAIIKNNNTYANDSLSIAGRFDVQILRKEADLKGLLMERDRINNNYGKSALYSDKITNNRQIQFVTGQLENLQSEKRQIFDSLINTKHRIINSETAKIHERAKENFNFAIIILVAMPLLYFLFNLLHWFVIKETELLNNINTYSGQDSELNKAAYEVPDPE